MTIFFENGPVYTYYMGRFSKTFAPMMGDLFIIRCKWLSRHVKKTKTKTAKFNIILNMSELKVIV